MKKFYTVYRITNLINNMIYIGAHETTDLLDTYMGSGDYIQRAIKKYGKQKFSKEIINLQPNLEQMYVRESLTVTEEFVKRKDTYNLKPGGYGGFSHINNLPKEIRPNFIKLNENKKSRDLKRPEKIRKDITGKNNSQYGTHLYCDQNGKNVIRFKEGNQPKNWLTTTEYRRINMKQGTTFNKHWYNDGDKNYIKFDSDALGLIKGRI